MTEKSVCYLGLQQRDRYEDIVLVGRVVGEQMAGQSGDKNFFICLFI